MRSVHASKLRAVPAPLLDPTPSPALPPSASPVRTDDLPGLFDAYSGYVATIAFRILGRDDDVDDIVQDVFLAALSGLKTVRSPDSIKAWLGTITVRKAIFELRRRRLRSYLGLHDSPSLDLVSPGVTPEQHALLQRIYTVLDDLPVADRVAWVLRYLEGESLSGVAQLSGCSLATAKRRVLAAQHAIKRVFHE